MILYMVLGNATMTKYRIVSDGYAEHLQYLRERKFLFFFSVRYWCYIWRPYYDRIWGRGEGQVLCQGWQEPLGFPGAPFSRTQKRPARGP